MNPICDTVRIKRGQYDIIDNNTNKIIDPKSITLKSVLDEEDGEMTPKPYNNKEEEDFELTINFDITNQTLVARRIRDEAKIPLRKCFYLDTEIGVDVRSTYVNISFYKNKKQFIVETLDTISDILGLTLSEYKLYDEIKGEELILYSNKKNTEQIIPYVMSIACPDYKRPFLRQRFGSGTLPNIKEIITKYILDNIYHYLENTKGEVTVEKIKNIYETEFWSDSYMSNNPWSAMAFINGLWQDITPTFEEIFKLYKTEEEQ